MIWLRICITKFGYVRNRVLAYSLSHYSPQSVSDACRVILRERDQSAVNLI